MLLWSEIERFFSLEHAAVFFLSGSKRLLWSEIERFFSLEHAAVFSLSIEEAALERNCAIFSTNMQPFFFSLAKRLLLCLILILAPNNLFLPYIL